MNKKIFKNCPGERWGRTSCDGCPRFRYCLKKKIKRKIRKNIRKILLLIVFIIISTVTIWQRNKEFYQKQQVSPTSEPLEVEQPKVAVATGEAIFVKEKKLPTAIQVAVKRVTKVQKKKKVRKKVSKKIPIPMKSTTSQEYVIIVSAEEKKLMIKVVYAEARGECYKGKIAVAAVIINRYIYNNGNISIKEIITAPYQFADITNITDEMLEEYPDCEKAVEEALKGNDPTKEKFEEGARYFFEPELVENPYQLKIREGIEYLKIGNHRFHNDFNE